MGKIIRRFLEELCGKKSIISDNSSVSKDKLQRESIRSIPDRKRLDLPELVVKDLSSTPGGAELVNNVSMEAKEVLRQRSGGCAAAAVDAGGWSEHCAAVKIQASYRSHLEPPIWTLWVTLELSEKGQLTAKRALKALKGLVKFQAMVRGFIVRRQVLKTFHGLQAMASVQVRTLSRRIDFLEIQRFDDDCSQSQSIPGSTPESSVCTSKFNFSSPNYMAYTESWKAKVQSQRTNQSPRSRCSDSNPLDRSRISLNHYDI